MLSVLWSFVDHSVIIQALRKGLIDREASGTGRVPRWKSSCPDRLAEATISTIGHRGVSPTLFRLKEYCVWSHMESHVREFVRQCLHCVDTRAGEIVPRPYGDTVHGTTPGEVVHLDFLYIRSSGPEGSAGLPEEDGFRYTLVIMDDLSNFVSF